MSAGYPVEFRTAADTGDCCRWMGARCLSVVWGQGLYARSVLAGTRSWLAGGDLPTPCRILTIPRRCWVPRRAWREVSVYILSSCMFKKAVAHWCGMSKNTLPWTPAGRPLAAVRSRDTRCLSTYRAIFAEVSHVLDTRGHLLLLLDAEFRLPSIQ